MQNIAANTCGGCWCDSSINDGGVEVCLAEGSRDTPLDAQHLSEGVLIAMSNLHQVTVHEQAMQVSLTISICNAMLAELQVSNDKQIQKQEDLYIHVQQ